MFNYYANQPILEKHGKGKKSNSGAYRSYTSSSVNKNKHPRSKSGYPSIIIAPDLSRSRYTSTNQAVNLKKERNIAKILDVPMTKYSQIMTSKSTSKSKSKSKNRRSSKGYKASDAVS